MLIAPKITWLRDSKMLEKHFFQWCHKPKKVNLAMLAKEIVRKDFHAPSSK
jgi:hypothetical protein